MARPNWTHVIVQKTTLARMKDHADKLLRLYQGGVIDLPSDQVNHVSMDYLVNHLINLVEAHRERAKRQRKRRKLAKDPVALSNHLKEMDAVIEQWEAGGCQVDANGNLLT